MDQYFIAIPLYHPQTSELLKLISLQLKDSHRCRTSKFDPAFISDKENFCERLLSQENRNSGVQFLIKTLCLCEPELLSVKVHFIKKVLLEFDGGASGRLCEPHLPVGFYTKTNIPDGADRWF